MGLGGFPGSHPNYTGLVGMHGSKESNKAVQECDLFISLGSRFNDRVVGEVTKFGKNARFIHIDIDGAEINKNVITHHHINADIKTVLDMINPLIRPKDRSNWLDKVQSWRPKRVKDNMREEQGLTPESIMKNIYNETKGDAVIVTDVGQHQMWAAQYYKFDYPDRYITSGGFGTMGYGLGAAIGSKLGVRDNGDRLVVHITGDGSFRMNCNELSTVEYYDLPIIHVIFNNGTLGMVRQWQTKLYDKRYSNTDLDRGPDFVKLAEAFNIRGYRVTTNGELLTAFKEAVASGKPALIECMVGMDEVVVPMVAPGKPITEFILE
jgi:acetolactate synthase-1/2/3 large subunit